MTAVRSCGDEDFDEILSIINEAAEAYRGIIPADRWKVPYMGSDELRAEIAAGVRFSGHAAAGGLAGVMGVQLVKDVRLIRHAYVRTAMQKRGIGSALLKESRTESDRPVLIGTWADARLAVRFYEGHGFRKVSPEEKTRLLQIYWSIPARQVETSVVLADPEWFARHPQEALSEDPPC